MQSMRPLKQCDSRRQVYFGLPGKQHAGLNNWVSFCSNMRNRKKDIDMDKLRKLAYSIEIRQKFRDWHLVTVLRRKARFLETRRRFADWRKLFLLSRFKILHAIIDNVMPLLRYRFWLWREKTKWLRAIEFNEYQTKKRIFAALKAHSLSSRLLRLRIRFETWKKMVLFVRKLKQCVSKCLSVYVYVYDI
jgi:hypothetical protein